MDAVCQGLTFLVIDDEPEISLFFAKIIRKMGGDISAIAANGAEALEALDTIDRAPDVLICDLNMPGMDGVELLRHVATRGFAGSIILVSGESQRILDSTRELAEAHQLNVPGVLRKPVGLPDFVDAMRRVNVEFTAQDLSPHGPLDADHLRSAIANGSVYPHFQPKVDVASGKVVGVEALARWHDKNSGVIMPGAFISLAERSGLIDALTDAVFKALLVHALEWQAEGFDLKLALNVSVNTLHRLDLPDALINASERFAVDPSCLILEVTESQLIQDVKVPLEILTRLRLKGIGLSIDDFGTGHSSLQQLKRIPFSELKIDRSFVNGASDNEASRAILEYSIDLARKFDMSIVAEGVETQADWNLIAELGCDTVQGYFVAPPMPAEDFADWALSWNDRVG